VARAVGRGRCLPWMTVARWAKSAQSALKHKTLPTALSKASNAFHWDTETMGHRGEAPIVYKIIMRLMLQH
jgi:hypothetical protein